MPLTRGKEPPLGGGGVELSETPCGEPGWLHLDDMRPSLWVSLAWWSPQALSLDLPIFSAFTEDLPRFHMKSV